MPREAGEGGEAIAEADLLALGPAPPVIADRHFDQPHFAPMHELRQLGGDLGTEPEAVLGQFDPLEHVALEQLVARGFVGQAQAGEPIARPPSTVQIRTGIQRFDVSSPDDHSSVSDRT